MFQKESKEMVKRLKILSKDRISKFRNVSALYQKSLHSYFHPQTPWAKRLFYIIMQLLTQYELSCILFGSPHTYYQFIVCAFTKYGAVQRVSRNLKVSAAFLTFTALLPTGYHLCLRLNYFRYA